MTPQELINELTGKVSKKIEIINPVLLEGVQAQSTRPEYGVIYLYRDNGDNWEICSELDFDWRFTGSLEEAIQEFTQLCS